MKSILITGAGGFIGSHLVERALADGWVVWAGVRSTTRLDYLSDPRLHLIDLPYGDTAALRSVLVRHKDSHGPWDVIVSNMGVTKTPRPSDFERVNCRYVGQLVEALRLTAMMPRQLCLMSSLSAFGPIHDGDGLPIGLTDEPHPDTAYGMSKLHASTLVKAQGDVPYVIFYPTGVYGPRERDYYLMFKTVRSGFDFVPGLKPQRLTFIYVADLVETIFRAIDRGVVRREYIVAEPRDYAPADFRAMIQHELGRRFVLPLHVPLWALKAINYTVGWLAARMGKASTLNADKYRIMRQRNWTADISAMQRELDFTPQVDLSTGVHLTAEWYKQHGWL